MKELLNNSVVKATNGRLTREQIQLLMLLVLVLLLVIGSGAPSTCSGWGGT